jgi:hypothetical protein
VSTAVFILSWIIQVGATSLAVLNLITKLQEIAIATTEVVSVSTSGGEGLGANFLIGTDVVRYFTDLLLAF